jgi:hypothetical protein
VLLRAIWGFVRDVVGTMIWVSVIVVVLYGGCAGYCGCYKVGVRVIVRDLRWVRGLLWVL